MRMMTPSTMSRISLAVSASGRRRRWRLGGPIAESRQFVHWLKREQIAAILDDEFVAAPFDALSREFFKSCNERQRHRHRRIVAGIEQKQARRPLVVRIGRRTLLAGIRAGAHSSKLRCNSGNVENHDDAAVAEDRCTLVNVDVFQQASDRFDDDFFRVEDFRNDEAELFLADLHDDDIHVVLLAILVREA
jgi:hypothetical protein